MDCLLSELEGIFRIEGGNGCRVSLSLDFVFYLRKRIYISLIYRLLLSLRRVIPEITSKYDENQCVCNKSILIIHCLF